MSFYILFYYWHITVKATQQMIYGIYIYLIFLGISRYFPGNTGISRRPGKYSYFPVI